jgi:hypothetical protein
MFYLLHWFRSFLPLHNPIGFGVVDFIELGLGAALVLFACTRGRLIPLARNFAERTAWCMMLLFTLPIALRLLLLPVHPVPPPNVTDDFSYLLLGDTLAHFRLSNPAHPFHQFFETYYVLQQPTYSSIYPLGQGLVLALGELLFRNPWAGVAISVGAMCALCYWMLRAWTTPAWSLAGGLLCAVEFGPLSHWMNSYWGGAVSACAGCLAFGALPRLVRNPNVWNASLLGLGIALEMLSRPFESIFLVAMVLLFLVPLLRKPDDLRRLLAAAPAAIAMVLLASALIFLHNKRVTGSGVTLPYMVSRYQYGIPVTFTTQPNPTPHLELTRQQQLAYAIQSSVHGPEVDTVRSYFFRLFSRAGFYRFFFLPGLYLALLFFFFSVRDFRFTWVLLTVLLFALGTNIYPYFYSHYIAALTCLFVLISVVSLQNLSRFSSIAPQLILFFCFAHFAFWYGLHLTGSVAAWSYESWDAINYGDPDGRLAVREELLKIPGKELVFVRYRPQHKITEWVFNDADIDSAKLVWARDLGTAENEKLRHYYPDRKAWLLEADARPPSLTPYEEPNSQPVPRPISKQPPPQLKFEEVK